jgi:hypothetical protein
MRGKEARVEETDVNEREGGGSLLVLKWSQTRGKRIPLLLSKLVQMRKGRGSPKRTWTRGDPLLPRLVLTWHEWGVQMDANKSGGGDALLLSRQR